MEGGRLKKNVHMGGRQNAVLGKGGGNQKPEKHVDVTIAETLIKKTLKR